jgi:hypothetical protein
MMYPDFTLTKDDLDLTTEFMMLLGDKEYFSSDDFRDLRLHERFSNPAQDIGMYFSKLKANGIAESFGELPSEIESNHKRKNDVWRWNWTRWRFLIRTRLDYFAEIKTNSV